MRTIERAHSYLITAAISLPVIHLLVWAGWFNVLLVLLGLALTKDFIDYAFIKLNNKSLGHPSFEHFPLPFLVVMYSLFVYGLPAIVFRLALVDSILDGTQDLGEGLKNKSIIIGGGVIGISLLLWFIFGG